MVDTEREDEQSDDAVSLAYAIAEIDTKLDERSCPHDGCHGSLTVMGEYEEGGDNRIICQTCRCTRDGEFHYPTEHFESVNPTFCNQTTFFYPDGCRGTPSWRQNPYPSGVEDGVPRNRSETDYNIPQRYDNSNVVKMPGGWERVYDEDDEERPDCVTDEYTFDLSDFDF